MRPERGRGLVEELQRSHRFTLGILIAVLILSLSTSGYLLLVSQPRLAGYVQLAREARDVHDGLLDQETGVRGWLATGDPQFLEPYRSGRVSTSVATTQLLHDMRRTPTDTGRVIQTLVAADRVQAWAAGAAATRLTPRQRTDGTLERILSQGKALFDTYRAADDHSTGLLRNRRIQALAEQNVAMIAVLLSYLLLLAVTGAVTVRRRNALRSTILRPIDNLHETITRLRSGDLSARSDPTAVPELAEIGLALGALAADLKQAGTDATLREQRLASLAQRFETVVTVGREIVGSLSVRYVSATVTTAAAALLGTTTVLWLRGENQVFEAAHRSNDTHDALTGRQLPPQVVSRAAAEGLVLSAGQTRAYPLVLAGTVTGVLEVVATDVDPDTEQVLDSLLSTAAAALESARLHSLAREHADHDGLTQLPNRRRFDSDIEAEWERCVRYSRPLSMVMLDLDDFKRLNDEFGHLSGDQVLREVAKAVRGSLRTTDTAYRYGGEEIVVLMRETGLQEATAASERLRRAVGAVRLPDQPGLRISTSAGVATRRARMTRHTELVAEADRALYEAKRLGRDRVVTAWTGGETLFHGDPDVSATPDQVLGL